jgi:uncharacterized protein YkwD
VKYLRLALIALTIAIALPGLSAASPAPRASISNVNYASDASYCADPEETAFLGMINDYRAQNGLGPLVLTQTLGAASAYHSLDMATYNYVSHTLHDGTTWSQNIINFGYTYPAYKGENVAGGFATAADVFAAWKASSGHNANMLSSTYNAIGIGRVYTASATYSWYWTTDFGSYVDAAATCQTSTSESVTASAPQPTATATATPTATNTPAPTATSTPQPTATKTATPVPTATKTATPKATATKTPAPTKTPTKTPTPKATATNTPAPTKTPTAAPTVAPAAVVETYVSAMTGSATVQRSSETLKISVTLKNTNGAAASGASVTVAVAFPNGTVQTLRGTTNSRGQASWSVRVGHVAGRYVASVSGVSSRQPYDPSLNNVASVSFTAP